MRNVPQHIIDRLKQQPRQGSAIEDAAKSAETAMNNLSGAANVTVAGMGKFVEMAELLPNKLNALAEATSWLEQRTNVLQKSFGLSVKSATLFYGNLAKISKEMGVGAQVLATYSANLAKLVGGYANLSKVGSMSAYMKDMLKSQTILQTQIGLTAEQANNFQIYSALQGKTATDAIADNAQVINQMESQFEYNMTAKELLGEMSNLSGDILLQYGKMPGSLQLAVTKAKLLGMSMQQLQKTGQNFLLIESSIGDELEYQLLSGRRLIGQQGESLTNAYRTATIQGDGPKQAELMNQIIEKEGDTIRNNLFARQQLAKTLGVEEAQLARTLAQQEMLKNLQSKGIMGANAEELATSIKNSTLADKDKLLAQLEANFDERTTEEKMLTNSDIMVATMLKAFGEPDEMALTALTRQQNLMDASKAATNVGTVSAGQTSAADIEALGKAVVGAGVGAAVLAPVTDFLAKFKDGFVSGIAKLTGTLIDGAGKITVVGDGPNKAVPVTIADATDGNDVAMGPGAGRVILGPEGAFNLNSKDSIMAGTNLGGGGGGDMAAFASAIVSAINNQTAELTRDNTYWS